MARYIDADMLKKELRKLIDKTDCNIAIMPDAFEAIENQPTADVKEVVRGEWINRKGGFGSEYDNCSVCHKDSPSDTKTRFCPYCGADMRGAKVNAKTDSI